MPVSQQHPSKNWGVLWASLCTIALFWALEVKVVERDQVDPGAKSKAVFLRITSAEWVWRRPAECWLAEVVGKAVAFGLSKICGLFGAGVALLRKIPSASWIMHFPLDRSMPVCVRLRWPANLWPGHVVVRVRRLWQDRLAERQRAVHLDRRSKSYLVGHVRERNRQRARADGRSHRARTEDPIKHFKCILVRRWCHLRQGAFEAPIVGLLFWAFSLGPPLAKSQKMADLGVLAKFVITRLYGHLWSRSLQQNLLLCLHFKCILIRRWCHLRQGVFEAPIVGLHFWAFSLGPPLAKSQKMADLGVLAKFVITRLYGHLWSRSLQQNLLLIKYLGVLLDETISFNHHISYICTRIARNNGIISKLRHYLTLLQMKQIYYSLIYPYISYAILAWGSAYKTHIDKIQTKQNHSARLILFATAYGEHTESALPLLNLLDVLTVHNVYRFQILKFTYLWHKGLLPKLFSNYFQYASNVHKYNTRYASKQNLYVKKVRTNKGKQTIGYAACIIWDKVPSNLKELNIHQFSKQLKPYLLSEQHN